MASRTGSGSGSGSTIGSGSGSGSTIGSSSSAEASSAKADSSAEASGEGGRCSASATAGGLTSSGRSRPSAAAASVSRRGGATGTPAETIRPPAPGLNRTNNDPPRVVTLYSAARDRPMITREIPWGAWPYWAVVTLDTSRPSPWMRPGTRPSRHSATSTITRRGELCLKVVKLGARSPAISTTVLSRSVETRTPLMRLDAAAAVGLKPAASSNAATAERAV